MIHAPNPSRSRDVVLYGSNLGPIRRSCQPPLQEERRTDLHNHEHDLQRFDDVYAGFAVYQCRNQGGNTAPGQNKVLVGPVTEPTHIDASAIKNGNLTFVTNPAVLTAPTTVSGAAAGCPNPTWTGVNPTLTVTDITLTISQGGVLLFTCTASNDNGLTGTVPLTC